MPKLGDHLGQVLSEIARARMQADIEAVRLADLYAKDALLKHFPVPRFRVLNVKLEIPVAVRGETSSLQNVDVTPNESNISNPPNITALSRPLPSLKTSKVTSIAIKGLNKSNIVLNENKVQIEAALQRRISKFDLEGAVPPSVTYMVDELANTLRKTLPSSIEEEAREKLIVEFQESTRSKLLQLQPKSAYIEVVVDTAELREIGPPEALTRIELSIVEEGMEWKQFEYQGDTSSRLRPE